VERLQRGDLTAADLSRELDVAHAVIARWRSVLEHGGEGAVRADGAGVPAAQLREAEQRITELERALGRKTMENEILRTAQEEVKKGSSRNTGIAA
jgi:transposase